MVKVEHASIRARDLTEQLLTCARIGTPLKKVSSVKDVINDTTTFALRGSKSTYYLVISDDLWSADVDKGQIRQVIHSLVTNADESMPNGGTITLKAGNTVLNGNDNLFLQAGKYLKISIEDEGTGIPEENLYKIFDPYVPAAFTSSLGLPLAYSIIKNHQGLLTVNHKKNTTGTIFTIYLPAVPEIPGKQLEREGQISNAHIRVLVMDDDPEVRNVVASMLDYLGYYNYKLTANGGEAIAEYKQALIEQLSFNFILIDLTIAGGMGGKETITEMLKINPNVKAIVTSGYSIDPVMTNFRKYGFSGVLTKPFTVEELANTLTSLSN